MKKTICCLAAVSMIACLSACGNDTSSSDNGSAKATDAVTTTAETEKAAEAETETPVSGGSFSEADACVTGSGGTVTLDQDASTLPATDSIDVSPSCYYDGDDKIFHYGDMDVYTYPTDGKDYVLEVDILTDGASTAGGLKVGMSLDDAKAIYGEGTDSGSMYKWTAGDVYMYVTHSGGTITSIGIARNI